MSPTVLPQPVPLNDYELAGPYPGMTPPAFLWNNEVQFAQGTVGNNAWTPADAGNSVPRNPLTNNSVGGGAVLIQEFYKGIQAVAMSGPGAGRVNWRFGNIMIMPVTDGSGLDAAYANPSWRRVQSFQWNMAMGPGDAVTDESGMLYAAAPGGQPANAQWPSGAATVFRGGFGVIGDSAGDWQWSSFAAGPPPNPTTEDVDLSAAYADAEDWNTFRIVTISAAGGRVGSLELHINGTLFLTRNWIDAPILYPLGLDAGVEDYHYIPTFQGGPGGVTHIGDWQYTCGRYLPDGRELLT